jgi:hypothetical protein
VRLDSSFSTMVFSIAFADSPSWVQISNFCLHRLPSRESRPPSRSGSNRNLLCWQQCPSSSFQSLQSTPSTICSCAPQYLDPTLFVSNFLSFGHWQCLGPEISFSGFRHKVRPTARLLSSAAAAVFRRTWQRLLSVTQFDTTAMQFSADAFAKHNAGFQSNNLAIVASCRGQESDCRNNDKGIQNKHGVWFIPNQGIIQPGSMGPVGRLPPSTFWNLKCNILNGAGTSEYCYEAK